MNFVIEFDDKKLVKKFKGKEETLKWDDIFSIDYYSIDCIKNISFCLSFNTEYGEFIEITDEMQGWNNGNKIS